MANPSSGDGAGSTATSPTGPSPSSVKPAPKSSSSNAPPSATPTSAQAQFHRFRLSEFSRVESSPTSASPGGHCSRFRVTDFVPWASQTDPPPPPPPPPPGVATNGGRSASDGSPSSATTPRTGSFSVMHMDVDNSGPQQTSTSVAAAAGSTRGVLQKITVPSAQAQGLKQVLPIHPRPLAPSPIMTNGMVPYNPATVPQEAVWELSRVLNILRNTAPETVVKIISDALISWPSVLEGSLLRRIGEIFPPLPAPSPAGVPGPSNSAASPQEPPKKKKRGRPPGKKAKLNDGSSATVPIAANLASMPPPPLPYIVPGPQAQQAPVAPPPQPPPTAAKRNQADGGKLLQCTRCLKYFNPTWRATPASDPSSEATCAVKHPFKDFPSGLEVVTPARRKNNYKTTWKWKCCGREVQSTSNELLMWPRKEDDRTGGWCFVGKHTTEAGVREKLGLKPGKGRKIHGDGDKKHKGGQGGLEDHSQANGEQEDPKEEGWTMLPGGGRSIAGPAGGAQQYGGHQQQQLPQPSPQAQPPAYQQQQHHRQQQQQPQPQQVEDSPDSPPKRKRGRPKGSKTRSKAMPIPTSAASSSSIAVTAKDPTASTPAQQHPHPQPQAQRAHPQDQSSFWTQYTEPASTSNASPRHQPPTTLPTASPSTTATSPATPQTPHHPHHAHHSSHHPLEDPAISTADLTLLASATAAMAGTSNNPSSNQPSTSGANATTIDAPEKRKRGRPKGSKNGGKTLDAGGTTTTSGNRGLRMKGQQQQQQQQQPQQPQPQTQQKKAERAVISVPEEIEIVDDDEEEEEEEIEEEEEEEDEEEEEEEEEDEEEEEEDAVGEDDVDVDTNNTPANATTTNPAVPATGSNAAEVGEEVEFGVSVGVGVGVGMGISGMDGYPGLGGGDGGGWFG